jgi:hypothetical protein
LNAQLRKHPSPISINFVKFNFFFRSKDEVLKPSWIWGASSPASCDSVLKAALFTISNSVGFMTNTFVTACFKGLAWADWLFMVSITTYIAFIFVMGLFLFLVIVVFKR